MSLEFWSLSQQDYKDAWERYLRFVREGGKKTFVGLCETAGIDLPFNDGALDSVSAAASKYLAEN